MLKTADTNVTVIAAAELGNGRVLAVSHKMYIKLFKRESMCKQ